MAADDHSPPGSSSIDSTPCETDSRQMWGNVYALFTNFAAIGTYLGFLSPCMLHDRRQRAIESLMFTSHRSAVEINTLSRLHIQCCFSVDTRLRFGHILSFLGRLQTQLLLCAAKQNRYSRSAVQQRLVATLLGDLRHGNCPDWLVPPGPRLGR